MRRFLLMLPILAILAEKYLFDQILVAKHVFFEVLDDQSLRHYILEDTDEALFFHRYQMN